MFEAIVKSAARLCGGLIAAIYRFDGELVHRCRHLTTGDPKRSPAAAHLYPAPTGPSLIGGRVVLARSIVRIPDARAEPDYDTGFAAADGLRAG